nr:integrase, catalytic region, zinc finger, CCHC-type, peptidase aspartic, catalytic [Tanacetum cinerariifolium]
GHFAKDCKKAKVKDYEYYKIKMLLVKKDKDEQVLLAEDQAWMESSSDLDQEINANMVFMAHFEKVLSDSEASSSSADEKISENRVEKANQQSKDFENQNKDLQDKYYVLKNQTTAFEINNNVLNEQMKELIEKNNDLLAQTKVLKDQLQVKHVVIDTYVECEEKYAKLEAEIYEYMIRYSVYFDNDKQHRKQIADQQVLFDKMSVQLVELDKHDRDLKNTVLEKDFKIYELEECIHAMGSKKKTIVVTSDPLDLISEKTKVSKSKEKVVVSLDSKGSEANDFSKLKKITALLAKQTSSLKPYVPNVIIEKIIIDLEEEVVNLLEIEKGNLETIEFLKSKGFESSENVNSDLENQSENDCLVVANECDKMENSKKKGSSNTSNVDLSAVSHSKLNKNIKRYSRKDLLACNNSHLGETRSAFVCNDAMNVSCDSRMNDLLDDNNFFIFDDESVRISSVSKMSFRKKPRDSLNVRSKSNSNKSLSRTNIDSGCSKHMTGNRALLTNFVKKFLGTIRFGNNDFAMIDSYGDVVIGSMSIKKVYYVEGLGHNLFSIGQFCDKGLEVAFRKSTCFVRNEDGVDLLTGDRSSNLYTIALNEVASNYSTCLLAKASSSQSWLWHQRLSHLNFATINNLVKNNLV